MWCILVDVGYGVLDLLEAMVLLVASLGLTKLLNHVFSSHKLALEAVNHMIPLDMLGLLRELISESAVWQPTPPQPPPLGIVSVPLQAKLKF